MSNSADVDLVLSPPSEAMTAGRQVVALIFKAFPVGPRHMTEILFRMKYLGNVIPFSLDHVEFRPLPGDGGRYSHDLRGGEIVGARVSILAEDGSSGTAFLVVAGDIPRGTEFMLSCDIVVDQASARVRAWSPAQAWTDLGSVATNSPFFYAPPWL